MRGRSSKKIISLALSITLVLSILSGTFINASANNDSPKATFSYGNYAGVEEAIGTNPDDIPISGDSITLPDNTNSMNLYWKNGENTYKAGTEISVSELTKDNSGNYPFTALFGDVSIDFDEIDTEPFTFATEYGQSTQTDVFFAQLNKNSWWSIPSGYANDRNANTAFGASNMSICKKDGSGTDNNLVLGQWAKIGTYFNAALFTHSPFDSSDENSHNSKATGKLNYKYVYFTPGVEYTLSFDYKIDDAEECGTPPYNASIAYGMATNSGDDNCGKKTVEYATGTENRTSVDLGTETGKWKRASVSIKAPKSYTGNGVTSARVGISLKVKTSGGCYIDNIELRAGNQAKFVYGEANGISETIGKDFFVTVDDNGNIAIPKNENAMNLLWKNGDRYYAPGTTVNIDRLNGDYTFKAVFAGASLDFEDIYTNNIKLAGGAANVNMFGELSRVGSYWQIPQGLSNTDDNGLALGDGSAGIISSSGKKGKGLRFESRPTKRYYYNAVLFAHSPTSFGLNDNITYSYVYYSPDTEYKMEFDYKSDSKLDVAVAFGVNTAAMTANCGTNSVNSASYDDEGNHISLEATNGEWKHASITVKSPSAYIGNGSTSARVGIAVKNYYTANDLYSYFDNVEFYPTDLGKMEFDFGGTDEGFVEEKIFKVYGDVEAPANKNVVATRQLTWPLTCGEITVSGWVCNETGEYYNAGDSISGIPAGATFSAVYGHNLVDFNDLPTDLQINVSKHELSYGSKRAAIYEAEDGNKCIQFSGSNDDSMSFHQVTPIYKAGNSYRLIGYNRNTSYKVSFKYRRTDNTDAESDLYVSFGVLASNWYAGSKNVATVKISETKKNMSDFETVTAMITAPSTYSISPVADGNYSSRAVGVGVTLSDGVNVQIDDFSIESATSGTYVVFDKNIGANDSVYDIIEHGKTVSALPEVSYDGFEFCGWYENRLGAGQKVSSITGDSQVKKYFAKWVPSLTGEGAAIKISGNDLKDYQLELPQNKTLVLSESLESFKSLALSKGATTDSKDKKIIIEDTSNKAIANSESSYTIKVENSSLIVTATDDAAMAGALDRLSQFIETAYEMNKTLDFIGGFNYTQKFVADDSQYSYKWSDEFNAEDLDKSIWLNGVNYNGPQVLGYQIGTGNDAVKNENSGLYAVNSQGVFLENGSAVIRAEKVNSKDAAGNGQYFISRGICSIGALQYTYGCLEVKAKLPQHPAAPSIWLYSSQEVDTSSEIDLHEGIGKVTGYENNQQIVSNLHAAYHLGSDSNKWMTALDASQPLDEGGKRIYLGTEKTNFDDAYHIYSVKWTPDEIVFALDGEVYYTYNFNDDTDLNDNATEFGGDTPFAGLTKEQIKECFSKSMYIKFGNTMGNLAYSYGPTYENGDPEQADLLVDYVRLYQSSDVAGTTFGKHPYNQSQIAEVEKAEKAFIAEKGIDNRKDTKTVVISGDGIESETIKINYGDTLPVNFKVGTKYITGWTDGIGSVKTYKDTSKVYTPQFIDTAMLSLKYKVADIDNDNCNILFSASVDKASPEYSSVGFVYSESNQKPTVGASHCISNETANIYSDGLFGNNYSLLNCEKAGYTTYSKYMFNFALKDVNKSSRSNNLYVCSYIKLSDGRVIYGDVLTIPKNEALAEDKDLTEFDKYIIGRLSQGATLDNISDYNNDGLTDIRDLINLKKSASYVNENNAGVDSSDLVLLRKVLLFYDNSKILKCYK